MRKLKPGKIYLPEKINKLQNRVSLLSNVIPNKVPKILLLQFFFSSLLMCVFMKEGQFEIAGFGSGSITCFKSA